METGEPIPVAHGARLAPTRAVAHALLLAALAASPLAAAQAPLTTPALPASATEFDTYRQDLDTALRLTSPAAVRLVRDVESARRALEQARLGLSAAASLTPAAEFERDLAQAGGAWDVELELDLSGAYRFDRGAVLRAAIALERAEARLRAQRRGDMERALLALSDARLAARALADAGDDAAAAASLLAEALAAGSPPREVEGLTLEAELAAIELERERLRFRDADAALAELGLYRAPAAEVGVLGAVDAARLAAPPSPQLLLVGQGTSGRPVAEARLLALELQLAEQVMSLVPFEVVRELELYGGYQAAGLEAGARLALEQGVPGAEASLGWQLGEDERTLTFGVSATLRLTNTSSDETRVAQSDVDDARAALASFAAAWPGTERQRRTLAQLAYLEFAVARQRQALAETVLAESATAVEGGERDADAVRRARDATERAWQRYVRALGDHLDVIDVVVRPD